MTTMRSKPTLTSPTDEQLNAAFAEHVARWKDLGGGLWWDNEAKSPRCVIGSEIDKRREQMGLPASATPFGVSFTHSFDAVLPWLEGWGDYDITRCDEKYTVMLSRFEMLPSGVEGDYIMAEADSDTLPRACVIAMLRANGVGLEVTK